MTADREGKVTSDRKRADGIRQKVKVTANRKLEGDSRHEGGR